MALPPRADMSEPFQIFQDAYFNQATPMISNAPMPSVPKPTQRRPMQANHSNTHNGNIVINPPLQPASRQSPLKMAGSMMSTSPLSPLKAAQGNKLNMVSFKPPMSMHRQTDSMQKKPLLSRFKTVVQKPPMDAGSATAAMMGKENSHPMIFPAPPGLNLSIENYYQKAPGKRLLEPAPIKDGRPTKKPRVDDGPLPPHDSFPPIVDDGLKPGHSYAMLIGMAILRSKGRKLTLSQIYKWISDTYSFYNPQDAGWQNSIRHNLSLNKAFVKQERPKDDPGKGNYWAIEAGMEYLFMKDKVARKPAGSSDNLQVMSTTVIEPSLPPMPHTFQEPALPPQLPPMPMSMAEPSSTAPAAANHSTRQAEPSSDATIIASDSAGPDYQQGPAIDNKTDATIPEPPTDSGLLDSSLYSPIQAAALHSSPPISRHIEAQNNGTPTRAPRAMMGSSTNRARKRKSASMDDSGYISSLESSALRSNQNTRHLPPEGSGDRSRIKRGRAEEEIARLRASSYDSPTKGRSRNGYNPNSSSPLRQNDLASSQMPPPPLTPAVKLKVPLKPPPSVSPGTNLRMHRDKVRHMLASPLRRIASASDEVPSWGSPSAFDESLYNFTDEGEFNIDTTNLGNAFEIFQDDSLPSFFSSIQNASPVKQPAHKRLRMDRAHSASALSEMTNSIGRRTVTSAPFLKVPTQSPGFNIDTPSKFFDNLPSSPSKFFTNLQSPSKMPASSAAAFGDENSWVPLDDFCTPEFLQDVDEFGGLDILQGFEKIGSTVPPQDLFALPPQPQAPLHSRAAKASQKPALGRSYTTNF